MTINPIAENMQGTGASQPADWLRAKQSLQLDDAEWCEACKEWIRDSYPWNCRYNARVIAAVKLPHQADLARSLLHQRIRVDREEQRIRELALDIWRARGGGDGGAVEDWIEAERRINAQVAERAYYIWLARVASQ